MKKKGLLVLGVVVIGVALYQLQPALHRWFNPAGGGALTPLPGRLAAPDAKNATYRAGTADVTLVNGMATVRDDEADGGGTTQVRYFGNEAYGDLNGDGIDDVAFWLTADPGGSGTFYGVAALVSTERGWVGSNMVMLGDRIAPQPAEIRDGILIANYADREPGEPYTTKPSIGVSVQLEFKDGRLVQL